MGGLLKSSKSILSGSGSSHRGGGSPGGGGGVGVGGWGGGEGSVGSVSQGGLSKGGSGHGSGSRRGQGLVNNNNNSHHSVLGSPSPDDGSLLSIDELVPLQDEGRDMEGQGQGKDERKMVIVEQRPGDATPGLPLGFTTVAGVSVSGDIIDEGDARAAVAMRGSLQGMGERGKDRGSAAGGSSQSNSAMISGSRSGGGGGGRGRGVSGDDNHDSSVMISESAGGGADDSMTRASQDASGQGLGGVAGEGSVTGGSVVGGSVVEGSIGTAKGLLAKNEVPFAILGKPVYVLVDHNPHILAHLSN